MEDDDKGGFRERCPNFTSAECERLARLVETHSAVLLNPHVDNGVTKEKSRAWEALAEEFNAGRADTPVRTVKQLRNKFRNLKKLWKETMSDQLESSDASEHYGDQSPKRVKLDDSITYIDADDSDSDSSPAKRDRLESVESAPAKHRSTIPDEHAVELLKQKLRHRQELHEIAVKQAKELHRVRMKIAKLKVLRLRRGLDVNVSDDSDNKDG